MTAPDGLRQEAEHRALQRTSPQATTFKIGETIMTEDTLTPEEIERLRAFLARQDIVINKGASSEEVIDSLPLSNPWTSRAAQILKPLDESDLMLIVKAYEMATARLDSMINELRLVIKKKEGK
jgi:hypothetical protein